MNPLAVMSWLADPGLMLEAQGMVPDPWQRALLLSTDRQTLLNCSRQAGKSTVVATLALHQAMFHAGSLVLILSPGLRQSGEFFRKVRDCYNALGRPAGALVENASTLELGNGSRIVCLPGKEGTIRGFSKVSLLIIDEAARVADDLYYSTRPMLAVSGGRLVALSTPFGQRGWFWNEWESQRSKFKKVLVTWKDCPRITPEFIASERASMGDSWVQQEYECRFTAMEGLVYPDFERAVIDFWPCPTGKPVGGIDFGWRNPFAAIWGVLDSDDILWIGWERYLRETPLHEHVQVLSRHKQVIWYADPAGATEIGELRAAGLTVRKGDNDIRLGIAAVTARIQTQRLKICRTTCANLISESKLYRYPSTDTGSRAEKPIDDNNHALAALRYLISKIDSKYMARLKKWTKSEGPVENDAIQAALTGEEEARAREKTRETLRAVHGVELDDEDGLWEILS